MSIERSRHRVRTLGPISPRPDGISRRVATAARDRQIGPLPEQRPTGWHRLVFDNPPRRDPVSPQPAQPDRPARPARPAPSGAPDPAEMPGPGPDTVSGRTDPAPRQVGRVVDRRPPRSRRRTAVLAAAVAVMAAAAVGAVLLVTGRSVPAEPAPGPVPASIVRQVPASAASTALSPADPASAAATPAASSVPVPSAVAPESAAVVSTLTPGDPGFGWPATAFGSASFEG